MARVEHLPGEDSVCQVCLPYDCAYAPSGEEPVKDLYVYFRRGYDRRGGCPYLLADLGQAH